MKNTSRRYFLDCLVFGGALFSMFFGAGNMIFPPFLGLQAGTSWFSGFISYFAADIGLAMVAMFALIRKGGPAGIVQPLGDAAGKVVLSVVALCLGLIIAVPRTAATTYELSIQPLFEQISLPVFCVAFFTLVLLLSITESAVVDVVGKILTPVLFLGLLFLIFKGVVTPVGEISPPADTVSAVSLGIASGYQTMDVFAAIFLGALVLNSVLQKGYTSVSAQAKTATVASLIAGIGLLVVYLGLTYLGATASATFSAGNNHTGVMNSLIQILLPGRMGTIFFGVVVGLACLTTAIALTSSTASFFSSLSGEKISYRKFVILFCILSAAIACIGVDRIISVAGSILTVAYPPVLVLLILSFGDKWLNIWAYRLGAYTALVVSFLETLGFCGGLLKTLPLSSVGFAWLLPAIIGVVIGQLCFKAARSTCKVSE